MDHSHQLHVVLVCLPSRSPLQPFFPSKVMHVFLRKWDFGLFCSIWWSFPLLAYPFQPPPHTFWIFWPILTTVSVMGCKVLASLVKIATQMEERNQISSSANNKKIAVRAHSFLNLQKKKCCQCIYHIKLNKNVKRCSCFAKILQFQPLDKKP